MPEPLPDSVLLADFARILSMGHTKVEESDRLIFVVAAELMDFLANNGDRLLELAMMGLVADAN